MNGDFKNHFYKLSLPRKRLSEALSSGYRIYKDKDNFVVVEASMASEALEKSGILAPYKIVKLGTEAKSVVEMPELMDERKPDSSSNPAENKEKQSPAVAQSAGQQV